MQFNYYTVIICPKCRKNSQVVDHQGQKTIKCQKCGKTLQLKKLKEFGKYEDWKSAQYMRAIQQAKLHGETVDIETLQKNDQQLEKKPRKKQNKKDIILEIIQKNNNKCHIDTIYDKTNEMGYVPEDIKKIIDHMEQEGLIYSPKPKTKSIV